VVRHWFAVLGVVFAMVLASTAWAGDAKILDTEKLVAIGNRHSLPMPPREARLVLAHTETWGVLGNSSTSRDPGIYSPAYVLEERPDGSVLILRGTETRLLQSDREPLWRPFSIEVVKPRLGGHVSSFSRLSAFVCAVQTAALGDEATAQTIWDCFSKEERWSEARYGEDIQGQLRDPETLLARCIFDHLRNAILQKQADWEDVRARMDALFKEFPQLDRDWRGQIFNDLTTTIEAEAAEPGSIEALLLDWAGRPSDMRHLGIFHRFGANDADAPAREIVMRGRDAVAELVALLDDPRITVHEIPAWGKASPRIQRVGDLARQLVSEIAGGHAGFPSYNDDTDAVRAWWQKAGRQDEAEFLTEGLFTREGDSIVAVNEGPARILAEEFPERLGGFCNEFSRHATPDIQPWSLAEAIAQSRLPKATRVHLLSEFAQRGSLEHKRCVLQNLAEVDDDVCAALLLPVLRTLPRDSAGPYWTCAEANFTHVVIRIEADNVWSEYLRAAKRSSVGLRMEMMSRMDYCMREGNRQRRLAFLAAFLDDDAVRRMPDDVGKLTSMTDDVGKFTGPCAGFAIPHLAVRDFAAVKLASLLDMEERADEFWTDAQWDALRQRVRERLAEERLPEL
jgi:hypothetical protein